MPTAAFLRGDRTALAENFPAVNINNNKVGTKQLSKCMNRPHRFYHQRTHVFFREWYKMHIFGEVHVILKSTEKTRVLKLSKVPQVQ